MQQFGRYYENSTNFNKLEIGCAIVETVDERVSRLLDVELGLLLEEA